MNYFKQCCSPLKLAAYPCLRIRKLGDYSSILERELLLTTVIQQLINLSKSLNNTKDLPEIF